MSRKDNLIKSKSIYTLRSKHTIIPNGTIFENDHVTIVPNDGIYNDDMPLFSDSNFKFRIGIGGRGKKKHARGGFIGTDGSNENVWTLENLPETRISTDGKIKLKPNYSSMKDFAYYGSAVELLRATVNDIIMRYPGGLYYYNGEKAPKIRIGNKQYYLVSNEFNIDFWSPMGCSTDGIDNPMRVLGASYMNYVDGDGNPIALNVCITGDCLDSVIGRVSFKNLNNNKVNTRNSDDEILGKSINANSILYYLTITAKTGNYGWKDEIGESDSDYEDLRGPVSTTQASDNTHGNSSATYVPLKQKQITFVATTSENGTLVASVFTDNDGIASVSVQAEGNGLWEGNGDASDIIHWVAYYSDGTNTYYNYSGTRIISDNEFDDEIIVMKNTNQTIHYPLSVWAFLCGTKNPIEGATVNFYMASDEITGTKVKTAITDEDGFAYFRSEDFGDNIQSIFNEPPTTWYSEVIYNGEIKITNILGVTSSTYGYACFDSDEHNASFISIKVTGLLNTNGNVGAGNESCINFYDGDNQKYTIRGVTDENGSFSVLEETFHSSFPTVTPIRANGEIKYNDEIKESTFVFIFEYANATQNHNVTVYFDEKPEIGTKTLMCDVLYNSSYRDPVEGANVVFTVYTDKSHYTYTATVTTNSEGLASIDIPSDDWVGNGSIDELAIDGNRWDVSCLYDSHRYYGNPRTLLIKNEQYRNTIIVEKKKNWSYITVRAKNNLSMLQGAMCTVCASTKSCGEFSYYSVGQTDSSGTLKISNNISDWNKFPRAPQANPNDFIYWKASARYHGTDPMNQMESCEAFEGNGSYVFVFKNDEPNVPQVQDCNGMNDSNSFLIYLNGNGEKLLLSPNKGVNFNNSVIIEPKKEIIDEFWENIDDFENVLLNRNSRPIYKAVLETPYVENGKHIYDYRSYVWPTINGYVPDITSSSFKGYLSKLMEIAEYHDTYDSDNLWRMMTHDSIKNLDRSGIVFSDADSLDLSRMEAMIRIHGRIYDDIKRYADGIKSVNIVTYDEKNNMPDYFLSDNVETGGFDVKTINEIAKFEETDNVKSVIASDNVFSGAMISGITAFEINGEFLKRLSISEKYILSSKGTRRGIEYILGMFGYYLHNGEGKGRIGDYSITEYIRVANNFPNYYEASSLRVLGNYTHSDIEGFENTFYDYPVAVVSPNGMTDEASFYLIPWVKNGITYYNDIYFQEKGGWGKSLKRGINLDITTVDSIESDYGLALYDETNPYMTYVNDLEELTSLSNNTIYEGMICYVTDINGLYSSYLSESDYHDSEHAQSDNRYSNPNNQFPVNQYLNQRDFSHYFVLENTALSTHIGYVKNELYSCYGWKNIFLSEFNEGPKTYNGLKVLYLESLSLNTKGNNPHCGYGNYDDGRGYIEKFNRLFGYALDSGEFDGIKDNPNYNEYLSKICSIGFDVSELIQDNEKCYYFLNGTTQFVDRNSVPSVNYSSVVDSDGNSCELVQFELENGIDALQEDRYDNFVNPENGSKMDECASFSVVNVKNLKITFYTGGNRYFEKYLQDVVFKYLKEMIPSTTILEFEFDGESGSKINDGDVYNGNGRILGEVVGDGVSVSNDTTNYLVENNEGIII